MGMSDTACTMYAPSTLHVETRLAGTGTTEATNTTALGPGCLATLMVGAEAIRINFGAATAPTVATTDLIVPAYGRFDWTVEAQSCFVSIEAADGAAAYEAWVWTSSGAL